MSYIGSTPTTQSFIAGTDYFNGTGSAVNFTLSRSVNSVNDIEVIVNNVEQIPSGYSVSGTTLTFSAAPSAGTSNVYVRYLSTTNLSLAIPSGTSATFNTVTATTVNTTALTTTNGASIQGLTVGKGAGAVATNTAFGTSALAGNSTGQWNTALGWESLKVSNGDLNTAVGRSSLQANTTGTDSTAVGAGALYTNTTGSYNTALGRLALYANTTASNNTAVGMQALTANTTASNNTAVGYQALYSSTTAANNTAVGHQAGYSQTTSAAGGFNVFMGAYAGNASTGFGNTFVGGNGATGYGAGFSMTTGTLNTILGGYSGNQGGLDIRTSSNYIVLSDGSGNPRIWVQQNGGVFTGLGAIAPYNNTSASAANLIVFSDSSLGRSTSALKYKQDIRDVEDFDINLLRPVRYKSKCERDDQTKDHFGLIADEAAAAGFEELVTRGADGEVEGFQYERLTVVLLKAIQEQQALITALTTRITALENNNATQ